MTATGGPAAPASAAPPAPRPDPAALAARLPAGFLLGAATAAYQIEGSWNADGKGQSIWDTFVRQPGAVERGEHANVACDSYRRAAEDAALCEELGLDAYRFSVAWSRVQPRGSRLDPRGLDHYDRFADALAARGIRPVLTLYHWDLPQWVQDRGGWIDRDTAARFADYAALVGDRLGDRVFLWATLNEPWVATVLGHLVGLHAPGIADPAAAAAAHHHLLLGHGLGVAALRGAGVTGGVGIVVSETYFEPLSDSADDAHAVQLAWDFFGRGFRAPLLGGDYPDSLPYRSLIPVRDGDLATVAAPLDFLGVNNYTRQLAALDPTERLGFRRTAGDLPQTEMGWEISPHSLSEVLATLAAEHPTLPPVYVTENGMADTLGPVDGAVADPDRTTFLADYLSGIADAVAGGVDVRGYFVWSLLDNFEWAYGYRPRFGLVHVDVDTRVRTVKDSGRWYAQLTRALRDRRT